MPVFARFVVLNLLPAAIVLALGYTTLFGGNGLFRARRVDAELIAANRHRDEVDAEVAQLQREVEQLRSDEATIKRAAAEDLLLVPKSSTVYRFSETTPAR